MREHEAEQRRRFDELFASHGADVVAYCSWRAGSQADAQDAAAEVFLTAWRRLDAVPEGDAARIWLYATARKMIANQRRSSRRRAALQERLTVEAVSRRGETAPGDTVVHDALRMLEPRDREILLLAEWEGLSPAQIGKVVGCLAVTARGRLHRARSRFRSAYEQLLAGDAGRAPAPTTTRHVREGGSA
jgi:RNA polymerase sigma factor (sigma-70 family)